MIFAFATLSALLQACTPAVSADTMRAIVMVESRGYSYAISDNTTRVVYCVPGGRIYPCGRERATAIAEGAIAQGHSVDVGIAQVNSGNFRSFHVSAANMLEPCLNLRVGGAILTSAYRSSISRFAEPREALWHAIMAYNTGSLYVGESYVHSVVDAATTYGEIATVPSVTLLEKHQARFQPEAAVTVGDRRIRRDTRNRAPIADARSSPLAALSGFGAQARLVGAGQSFQPVVSR